MKHNLVFSTFSHICSNFQSYIGIQNAEPKKLITCTSYNICLEWKFLSPVIVLHGHSMIDLSKSSNTLGKCLLEKVKKLSPSPEPVF